MIKAIIFDLDGVLVSTNEFHYLAWKKLADRIGVPFDRTKNKRLLGVSRMDSLRFVLENSSKQYSQEEQLALAEEKNETYKQYLQTMSGNDVAQEVRDTLAVLRQKGLKLAVGSGSKNARIILQKTQLEDCFDAIVDGSELTLGKPNPEVFLKAAQKVGIPPQNCIVVEDADAGIAAAKNGGMTAVAIGEAAKSGNAHFTLGTFADLLSVVEKLNG